MKLKNSPENVTINFNTFQVNFTEEDEEKQKEKLKEYSIFLEEILGDLPNVRQAYNIKPNGDLIESKYSKHYANQYNMWHEALSKASNVVMNLLQKRPLENQVRDIDKVIITKDQVMFNK